MTLQISLRRERSLRADTGVSARSALHAGLVVASLSMATAAAWAQAPTNPPASAASPTSASSSGVFASRGKLLLTSGVSSVEGAAGGGLTPWATTASYADQGEVGFSAFASTLSTQAFGLNVVGAAVGIFDRVELSFAQQSFNTRQAGAALRLGANFKFSQDIVGVKVKVAGDAVLDADSWMPQIAVGAQFKQNHQGAVVRSVGARSDSGVDYYVSATKLFLAQGLLVNGTLRATKANQFGLLGFGGPNGNSYRLMPEISLAYLLSPSVAVGVEYRAKPNNLAFAREQAASDVFVAWAPNRNVSLTVAYVNLGDVATVRNQRGWYASLQVAF